MDIKPDGQLVQVYSYGVRHRYRQVQYSYG